MTEIPYTVVYERADDGYWNAFAVDLPVVANADSRREIEGEIREAIRIYLEFLAEEGAEPPLHRSEVGVVAVPAPA